VALVKCSKVRIVISALLLDHQLSQCQRLNLTILAILEYGYITIPFSYYELYQCIFYVNALSHIFCNPTVPNNNPWYQLAVDIKERDVAFPNLDVR
jgi:hypothetical protein